IGAQAGEALGAALAQAAGDWTGGLPGMLVGSPTGGDSAAGAIRVLALDSGGSVSESHLIDGANGGLSGPLAAGDGLGFGLATAGDSDGDGMSELLAGAPGDDGAGNGRGAAWALELKRDSLGVGFCYADGTCPCGNAGTGAAGCANSVGTGGAIFPSGSASITADDLMLSVSGLPPSKFGLIFMGDATIPALPMADGMRCVSGSLFRFGARLSDGSGVLTEGPGIVGWTWNNLGSAGHILAGDTWSFQCWYRDLKGPCGTGSNVSSALAITFVL
ncbi:MAG: integrin alpha, partial [Planctomycetota bacterium]|nr:integrin alpha [Planctomycetota bacterium]